MKVIVGFVLGMLLGGGPAYAVLGQTVATVQSDRTRLHGELRAVARQGYSVQEITSPNRSVVREYVSPQGMVFGIAWQSPSMPDLSQLLGSYFPAFQKQAQSNSRTHRAFSMKTDQLVVESGGHMRAFQGRAYVPSLLPSGITPAVIQ
jgi:hypothetical protein